MSHHHSEEVTGVVKNYTVTALTSFVIMFFLFLTLSRCHGDFHPAVEHHSSAAAPHH